MTNISLILLSLTFTCTVKSEHHLRKQGVSKIEVVKNVNKRILFQKDSKDS